MTMVERIKKELVKRIIDNKFESITITMKCNGDEVIITPCSYVPTIVNFEQIDYFLVDCRLPWAGFDNIDKLADFLLHYKDKLTANEEEKKRLHAYYDKYHNTPEMDWGWYSDWHKSLYGFRPR